MYDTKQIRLSHTTTAGVAQVVRIFVLGPGEISGNVFDSSLRNPEKKCEVKMVVSLCLSEVGKEGWIDQIFFIFLMT